MKKVFCVLLALEIFNFFQLPKIESPTLLEKLPRPDLSFRSLCLGYKCRHGFVASYLDNKSPLSSFYEGLPQHLSVKCENMEFTGGWRRHILHFINWKTQFSSFAGCQKLGLQLITNSYLILKMDEHSNRNLSKQKGYDVVSELPKDIFLCCRCFMSVLCVFQRWPSSYIAFCSI